MKLRDFLKVKDYSGKETDFILGRFILVGSYSGKKRYDRRINSEKILNRYLDCVVERLGSEIELNSHDNSFAESAIVICVSDYELAKEEEKAKHKEKDNYIKKGI